MGANVVPDQAVVSSRACRGMRILLVWGVRFTGECLAELLERDPLVSVIGLCADLSEAVALSASTQPDIILLDGRMPEGAAAVRLALDASPGMRIVVSSVRETEDDVVVWAEAGVIGYIPRTTSLGDFVRQRSTGAGCFDALLLTTIHDHPDRHRCRLDHQHCHSFRQWCCFKRGIGDGDRQPGDVHRFGG